MSKHRKHRGPPVDASNATPPKRENQPSSPAELAAIDSPRRRVFWQLVALFGASVVLGVAFNAASPVGVQFGAANSGPSTAKTALTNSIPTSSVVAATNRVAILPPIPSPRIEQPAATPSANPAPVPLRAPAQATNQPSVVTSLPTPPPTPAAGLNPAPIHWLQAKPMVAAGQAVLVDVRAKGMYDAGHIPGAISLPEASSLEEFNAFLNQLPTNLTLIVYCSSTSCSQSARVAGRLVTQYQRPAVKYMTGGYLEYQQEQAKDPSGATP